MPEAQGAIFGLTRATTTAEIARAALEGVAFQVADLIEAASQDAGTPLTALRVDGGMTANAWFLQRQADVLGLPVLEAAASESTALGAAYLAGLQMQVWSDKDQLRELTLAAREFQPAVTSDWRSKARSRWSQAVQAVIALSGQN